MRRIASLLVLNLIISSMLVLSVNIHPCRTESTITVPDDYLTIQEAINTANSGDTIFVRNGTYFENVILNKTVSLIGENRDKTVIDGNMTGNCVTIEADNATIANFKIQTPTYPLGIVIVIANCSGVKVTNNILRNARYKMLIENCSDCVFEDNFVTEGVEGIIMRDSERNRFSRNSVFWCSMGPLPIGPFYGIVLENSHENYFEYNEVADCDVGIALSQSCNNTFYHNSFFDDPWRISYHAMHGIRLESGSNGNVIVQNRFEGLSILALIVDGHSCRIYHNDFIDSSANLGTSNINFWDDGYPSGGNYWSYFEFEDQFSGEYQNVSGSDGIGDSPYIIFGNNMDNYPLMGPWTETGENVTVVDGSGISVMFENVTMSGITSASEIMGGPEPPDGFTFVNEPVCYEIRTTASYSGTVTIGIPYNDAGMAEKEEALIGILYWNETEQMWMNVTSLVNNIINVIYGETSSLSLFALAWPFIWDVTGDEHVGIDDIVLVAEHFGQSPVHPEWNPIYDISGDNYVGIDDVVAVAGHFGESV